MGLILKGWMMSYGVSSALPLSYGSDPEGMDDVICLQVATLITAESEQEHLCFG